MLRSSRDRVAETAARQIDHLRTGSLAGAPLLQHDVDVQPKCQQDADEDDVDAKVSGGADLLHLRSGL